MRFCWQRFFCAVAASVCWIGSAAAQITVGSLADELGNRDALAIHPNGTYTQQQASSHDTRNGTPAGSQLGQPWGYRNVDFGNYIRAETNQRRDELVMFEDSGPGAITRWWMTGIGTNLLRDHSVRIYLDGSDTPTLTATGREFFGDLPAGVSPSALGYGDSLNFATRLVGGNIYGPITYSSGIKVTWDGPTTHGNAPNIGEYVAGGGDTHNTGDATWYNINYRRYAPGTNVESFDTNASTTYASQLGTANGRLSSTTVHGHISETDSVAGEVLANGVALTRSYTAGGGTSGKAIREITLDFNGQDTADHAAALAGTYVELTFDGRLTARVPVGQFFNNGWSNSSGNPYNTGGGSEASDYYRTVTSNGTMTSRWVMPFQENAEVRLVNNSNQEVNVDLIVKTGDFEWSDDAMHFYANYRAENGMQTDGTPWPGSVSGNNGYSAEGDADFRFLNVRGSGVYVGDTLSVRNPNGGWWGEGDEKIYVDYLDANGDGSTTPPTQVGTGTEDYYGYSFGDAATFESPFVTQPSGGAQGGAGNVTVDGRVRGLDAIPFDESFKFDMELWKWGTGTVDQGAATFWYGRPGAFALNTVANLATDFRAAQNSGDAATDIGDTTGDGTWQYLSSDNANPSADGADLQPLTWGTVGNTGNPGYGGGENGSNNLAAISDEFVFSNGGDNIGTQGGPGYHELALHPGGDGFDGDAGREYVVAQWTAGDSVDGLINISGSVRNLIDDGDSVDFHIYVNGVLEFSVDAAGATLSETPFDFDSVISPGQSVDFVLGNGGSSNPFGDEVLLRAMISADYIAPITIFGDLDGDGAIGVGDWRILRDNFDTRIGDLNGDGINNVIDFGLFKDAYIATHGQQAFASLLAVPEPSAVVIGGLLLVLHPAVHRYMIGGK